MKPFSSFFWHVVAPHTIMTVWPILFSVIFKNEKQTM